jgi:hypothetical protein
MTPAPRRERISPSTRSGAARAGSSPWSIARRIADHPVRPRNPHVDRRAARRVIRRSRQRERRHARGARDARGRAGRGQPPRRVHLVRGGSTNRAASRCQRRRSADRAISGEVARRKNRGITGVGYVCSRRTRLGSSKHDRDREPGSSIRYGRNVEAGESANSLVTANC